MEIYVWVLLGLLLVLIVLVAYLIGKVRGIKSTSVDGLPPNLVSIYNEIQSLPSKILSTIQGSINPQKGKVAELLTYAELRHDYDIIIPLGQPFDFLGIKFNQRIDFIEVKSKKSKLSENEKAVSQLVRNGKVNFRLIVISDEEAKNLLKDIE